MVVEYTDEGATLSLELKSMSFFFIISVRFRFTRGCDTRLHEPSGAEAGPAWHTLDSGLRPTAESARRLRIGFPSLEPS